MRRPSGVFPLGPSNTLRACPYLTDSQRFVAGRIRSDEAQAKRRGGPVDQLDARKSIVASGQCNALVANDNLDATTCIADEIYRRHAHSNSSYCPDTSRIVFVHRNAGNANTVRVFAGGDFAARSASADPVRAWAGRELIDLAGTLREAIREAGTQERSP